MSAIHLPCGRVKEIPEGDNRYLDITESEKKTALIHLDSDGFGDSWYRFFKKSIAMKTYLFILGRMDKAPDEELITYILDDHAALLPLKLNMKLIEEHTEEPSFQKSLDGFLY